MYYEARTAARPELPFTCPAPWAVFAFNRGGAWYDDRLTRRAAIARTPTAISLILAAAAATHAQVRLGAMGDSLSDEYAEEAYSYARNWTMQLVLYRGVDMGPTAAAAQQPGGTWGEPRRTGYQYNWATLRRYNG